MLSKSVTAAAYHARAREAAALAETTVLERVREKHEVAAARWRALAALHERGALGPIVPAPALQEARDEAAHPEETPCIT